MKKHYFFKFVLLLIPVSAFVLLSFSSGRDSSFSGSPGDGGNNCTACHTGTASSSNITITSNIPDTGYDFNTTYNVTITNSAGSARNGFQVTAERDDNNGKVGTFVSGGSDTQAVNSGQRITHTSNGNNQSSWTFQWTSPSTDVGRVTFYGASVSGNGANGSQGDQVFLGQSNSSPSLSVDNLTKIDFDTYPNPAKDFVTLQLASNTDNAVVAFYDSLGKIALQTNITNTQNKIDVNSLASGIYLVKIISGNSIGTQKFIKE